jgi:hypothetical protein
MSNTNNTNGPGDEIIKGSEAKHVAGWWIKDNLVRMKNMTRKEAKEACEKDKNLKVSMSSFMRLFKIHKVEFPGITRKGPQPGAGSGSPSRHVRILGRLMMKQNRFFEKLLTDLGVQARPWDANDIDMLKRVIGYPLNQRLPQQEQLPDTWSDKPSSVPHPEAPLLPVRSKTNLDHIVDEITGSNDHTAGQLEALASRINARERHNRSTR